MKKAFIGLLALILLVALGQPGHALAESAPQTNGAEPPPQEPLAPHPSSAAAQEESASFLAGFFPPGPIGTVYQSAGYLGETGVPYLDDIAYLNRPIGIYAETTGMIGVARELDHVVDLYGIPTNGPLTLDQRFGNLGRGYYDYDERGSTSVVNIPFPKDLTQDESGRTYISFLGGVIGFDEMNMVFLDVPFLYDAATDTLTDLRNPTGLVTRRITHPSDPTGSADLLFVSNTVENRVEVMQVLTAGTGEVDYQYLYPIGADMGVQLNYPTGLDFDGTGNLLIADSGNHRILRCSSVEPEWLDPTGVNCAVYIDANSIAAGQGTDQIWAQGVAVEPTNGSIFVMDGGNSRLMECSDNGSVICSEAMSWLELGVGREADVSIDSNGFVFVSHPNHMDVHKLMLGLTDDVILGSTPFPYPIENGLYNTPWGITVDEAGNLYVMEEFGFDMVKLDPDGIFLGGVGVPGVPYDPTMANIFPLESTFGSSAGGLIGKPGVDLNGRVYIPDATNHRVEIFDQQVNQFIHVGRLGVALRPGTDNNHFNFPTSATVNPTNGDILVTDHLNHRIQIFNSSLQYKMSIGTGVPGDAVGQLNLPMDTWVDRQGRVIIADSGNARVLSCWPAGATYFCYPFISLPPPNIGPIGLIQADSNPVQGFGEFPGEYAGLNLIGVGGDVMGRVFVTLSHSSEVYIFDLEGRFLTRVGGWGDAHSQLRNPGGAAMTRDGTLYVTDNLNHRIVKYTRGYPGWNQINLDEFGMGDKAGTVASFKGRLYSSTNRLPMVLRLNGGVWETAGMLSINPQQGEEVEHLMPF